MPVVKCLGKIMSENKSMNNQIQEMLDFISTEHIDTAEPLNDKTSKLFWVNEIENTVDSIETAVAFFDRRDEYKWKWISF